MYPFPFSFGLGVVVCHHLISSFHSACHFNALHEINGLTTTTAPHATNSTRTAPWSRALPFRLASQRSLSL